MSDHQAKEQVKHWISHFEEQMTVYRTNNILILWGDDFAHRNAENTYGNLNFIMEKIEEHMENIPELKDAYHLKYSSIDTYLKSVQ